MSFVQILSPGNQLELRLYGIIAVNNMRSIEKREELSVSEGRDYTFPNVSHSGQI